jgi:outer membrane protein OmpA-like peptidoglycan-associated protein
MKNILLAALVCFLISPPPGWGQRRPSKAKKTPKLEWQSNDVLLRSATGINTASMEFAPARYQSGLVYVTSRDKYGPRDEGTGETYFELYFAELDPDGMPVRPRPFSLELNSMSHESSVTFSPEGDRIYFTRNNMVQGMPLPDSKGVVQMKIYQAEQGYYDWENIRELPFNNNEYSCMHPSLSPDGTKLFFASNMPGGIGGFDLYFVEKIGGQWSAPINLGPEVNTLGNEIFPFIHESGILFFTSDGHKGLGGLDLFMIDVSEKVWGDVINLGEPFNSPADDLSIYLNPTGVSGYFASNRDGGFGRDDIYFFEAPRGIQGVKAPERQVAVVTVFDGFNSRRLSNVAIRAFQLAREDAPWGESPYEMELIPAQENPDSLVMRHVLKDEEGLGPPLAHTDRLGEGRLSLALHHSYVFVLSKPGYKARTIQYTPRRESRPGPIEIMLDPIQCLTLKGRVVDQANGQPIAQVQLRVINECNGESINLRSQSDGSFEYCLDQGCDYTIVGEKNGFKSGSSRLSTVKIRGSRSMEAELRLLALGERESFGAPIHEGAVIVLDEIYYDFGKSSIRRGSARSLDALVRIMRQYSSMEIELSAHTDSRGSAEQNMKLSVSRAESAKAYLVERGVAPHRIRAVGYGENFPRNHCIDDVECSEEEHQHNRRTEVKVIKMNEPVRIDYRQAGSGDLKNNE